MYNLLMVKTVQLTKRRSIME